MGIVGRNGDGKSTLLNLLAGAGARRRPRAAQRRRARGRAGTGRLARPLPRWGKPWWAICLNTSGPATRASAISYRVGRRYPGTRRWERCRAGSAVEWPRAALIGDQDVLALDEPTNHLDVRAITWLAVIENPLEKGRGRMLVDATVGSSTVCLRMGVHDKRVEPFEGSSGLHHAARGARSWALAEHERRLRRELAWLSRGTGAATAEVPWRAQELSPTCRLCATSGAQAHHGAPGQTGGRPQRERALDDKTSRRRGLDHRPGRPLRHRRQERHRARPRCCVSGLQRPNGR
ncbi:MAG: hypothetical protein ACLTMP_02305 [Eggerthella lenta]